MVGIVNIGLLFFLIILLVLKKLDLWLTLIIGSVLLGLLFQTPVSSIGEVLLAASMDPETLKLIGALLLILLFSNLMDETGELRKLLESFKNILRDLRIVVGILPAIIGLMPLMGGALISAPMVVTASDELNLSREKRTFLNYWFRHIWEYVLPTYPGIVLASAILGVSIREISLFNLPLFIAAVCSGIIFGYKNVRRNPPVNKSCKKGKLTNNFFKLLRSLSPLLFALFLVIALKVDLVYSFVLTIAVLWVLYRISLRDMVRMVRKSISIEMALMVLGVMFFQKMLETTKAVSVISESLSAVGFPGLLIVISLPFIVGILTGITIAFVGITFPILLPFFHSDGHFLTYMMLSYASGYCGVILSPMHLCLILTKDYFNAGLNEVYRLLWLPAISVFCVGLIITLIWG
ncbi:MAG: DUF401 family protein [Thermodesulfobacteriota bacterium]